MTHDELLAKINPNNTTNQETYIAPYNALRAVVELHKPTVFINPNVIQCDGCCDEYPCRTIQAIEKELG